eukprot:CAMPEP_0183705256 /NCGR_PEP_ID=MMETSP0737-20130205/2408_1 /TAXON_ID=385413 /ORGANISM="Thalassiosira miniscula, Strain CCMP1093" /LENGTH=63 /DNA_ID=CAMNT_0025932371 /DNA_START=448 /DNA_END=639 /DNA_ORIENTATION=-
MGGVLESRYVLAAQAYNRGNLQLAMKHLIISAKAGYNESMNLMRGESEGFMAIEEFAKAFWAE